MTQNAVQVTNPKSIFGAVSHAAGITAANCSSRLIPHCNDCAAVYKNHSCLVASQLHTAMDWLSHWGRVRIYASELSIIGSDNGLSPSRHQAIIWTNDGILLIGPLGTNFSEILIEIPTFSFKEMRLKVSSAKWRPCCLGLSVLSQASLTWYCIPV